MITQIDYLNVEILSLPSTHIEILYLQYNVNCPLAEFMLFEDNGEDYGLRHDVCKDQGEDKRMKDGFILPNIKL